MKNVHAIYHVQLEETNILVGRKELASLICYSIDEMTHPTIRSIMLGG